MCVIRTLATSESNEQREREKAKLEREYTKSDQQLNELVSLYKQDLTTIMQVGYSFCEFVLSFGFIFLNKFCNAEFLWYR